MRVSMSSNWRDVMRWSLRLLAAFFLGAAALGCVNSEGAGQFHVSGTATFDGQPIPAGKIVFTPDIAAENKGPQGFADIRDGKYDTSMGGQGVVGGKHDVQIQGFDASVTPGGAPPKPLFIEYTLKADLPKENSTQDFVVPASAAAGLVIGSEPPP